MAFRFDYRVVLNDWNRADREYPKVVPSDFVVHYEAFTAVDHENSFASPFYNFVIDNARVAAFVSSKRDIRFNISDDLVTFNVCAAVLCQEYSLKYVVENLVV